jgi:hypothetical protein
MPPSNFFNALGDQYVAIHPLEAARAPRRAGVRIVALREVYSAQGANDYLLRPRQCKDERINSRLISLGRHDRAALGEQLFEIDAFGEVMEELYEEHIKARLF